MTRLGIIGVGIIGAGHIGAVHARAIALLPGIRLVASCRTDAAACAAFARDHGGAAYTDHRALLADPAVDAVLIATPHHLHVDIAADAAAAGKAIMVEKPIAPSLAECDRLLTATAGVIMMPGHTMRFTRAMRVARELLARDVGPRFMTATFAKRWMESNRRDWHLRPETGGGMLLTAGLHALDRVLYLAGQPATHVSAVIGTRFHDQPADDVAMLQLRFADGSAAQIASVGMAGGAMVNDTTAMTANSAVRVDFSTGIRLGRGDVWETVPDSTEPDWAFRAIGRQWADLAAAMRGEAELPVTGAEGRHVIAVIAAAMRAARSRCEEAI